MTFRYRQSNGVEHHCRVGGEEFVRRLLQHVPPKGFQRGRHYGWLSGLANAQWQRILALLDWRPPLPQLPPTNSQPILCPCCGKPMRLIGTLPRKPP